MHTYIDILFIIIYMDFMSVHIHNVSIENMSKFAGFKISD